ncbi:pilus assembly protein CpaE [Acidipropionibacterium acidipropionici]|uniref:pilus assembly protein CpaE n=1 Tax=Acidipropionibacterium acidipropionici TaxID=1748 RepID=UPI001F2F53AE|nr:pilus assembly protein CpaE [Acidipropionibacterium acidipropionici]
MAGGPGPGQVLEWRVTSSGNCPVRGVIEEESTMISLDLARRVSEVAPNWVPVPGDRFVIAREGLLDDVFMVAEMVVEVGHVAGHGLVRFNGTTEWALDSIAQDDVVWIPREDQLRALLGDTFQSLTRVRDRWVVTLEEPVPGGGGQESRHSAPDPETAYARAVLWLLGGPGFEDRGA